MNLSEDQIKNAELYLRNLLPEKDVLAFEEALKSNAQLKEYVEISRQLNTSFDDDNWLFAKKTDSDDLKAIEDFLKTDEAKKAETFFKTMSQSNNKVKPINVRLLYLAVAAVLVIFLVIPFFINSNLSNEELYVNYSEYSNLPSFVNRSETKSTQLVKAEQLFKDEKYNEALAIFQAEAGNSNDNATVLIYQGLSQIELKQYSQAEQTFNSLLNSDLIDSEKSYWYKALLYLKQNKEEETKAVLNTIISKNLYNYKKAKVLLSQLEDE